jgi:hypothetical protein
MRFIDADKLKECYTGTNGVDDKATYASIRAMIDNQSTAYDVEKVVQKLREHNYYSITVEDAVKIVEGGGLDE